MNSTFGGAVVFVIVVLVIGAGLLGFFFTDKIREGQVDTLQGDLGSCQANLADSQARYSDCFNEEIRLAGEVERLTAEIEGLRIELARTENALGETKASLNEVRQALVSDYLINGTIALGCVLLGAAIGLTIPFVLYLGGVITIAEMPKKS